MKAEDLKHVIEEQRVDVERNFGSNEMVQREGLDAFSKHLSAPFAFVTSGVRRCGKSIFSLELVRGKRYGYVNFDDDRLDGIRLEDMDRVLEAMYAVYGDIDHIVLDEVQNVPRWELFVNRLQRSKRVLVTGSNALLLSKELGTRLTGRYIGFTLHPFSFREYLGHNGVKPNAYLTQSVSKIKGHLEEYMAVGGFPEAYKFGQQFLRDLYNSILTKDIVVRHRIKYQRAIEETARFLVSNYAREFSYSSLAKMGRINSVNTVKNYVSHMEAAFLLRSVPRFSYSLKVQNIAPRKVYCIDTGLVNAVGFAAQETKGKLMENLVAVELMRRQAMDPRTEIFYWKDHQGKEVDFVLKNPKAVTELIQVTYASEEHDLEKREMASLKKAEKDLRCKKKTIITWEYEDESEGTRFIPLWKWLLNNDTKWAR